MRDHNFGIAANLSQIPQTRVKSSSTQRRKARRQIAEPEFVRRFSVEEVISAIFCHGSSKDYIPMGMKDGPLVEIVETILKKESRIASRYIIGVAKDVYFHRMNKTVMARRHIFRAGQLVKRRAKVFAGLRLPDPRRGDTLTRPRRMVSKHFRAGRVDHVSVDAAITAVSPLLSTYRPATFEYAGYPRDAFIPVTIPVVGQDLHTVTTAQNQLQEGNEQLYVSRVEQNALNDAEYLVLKRVLSSQNAVLLRASVKKWIRTISALASDGQLTSVEMYVVEYSLEENSQRRAMMGNKLKRLHSCLTEIRKVAGRDLYQHIGYNAIEIDEISAGTESGDALRVAEGWLIRIKNSKMDCRRYVPRQVNICGMKPFALRVR